MSQQIIIVVSTIIGLCILYFVGRYVIAAVSPETDERIERYFILKDIKRYFGFLLERGYKIREAHYSMHPNGSWHVEIESKDCVISIVQDRGEILAYFSPPFGSIPSNDKVSIEAMIYFLSDGNNIVESYRGNLAWGKGKKFERLAGLLQTHIDQIAPHFEGMYYQYKSKLKEVERQYFNRRVAEIARQKTK
jgi:hypothetical protein